MTAKRWDGTTQTTLSVFKRWDGSSYVNLTVGKRWDGVTWVDMGLFGGGGGGSTLAVSSNDSSFVNDKFLLKGATVSHVQTLTDCVISVAAGTAPYTYSWTLISGDSAISPTAPTSATTRFSANIPTGTFYSAVFRCTVTDSVSVLGFVDITVGLSYDNGSLA